MLHCLWSDRSDAQTYLVTLLASVAMSGSGFVALKPN